MRSTTDITDNTMLSQPLNLTGVNTAVSSSQVSFVSGQLSVSTSAGVSQSRGPMPPPSPGADVNLAWPRVNGADSMTVSPARNQGNQQMGATNTSMGTESVQSIDLKTWFGLFSAYTTI